MSLPSEFGDGTSENGPSVMGIPEVELTPKVRAVIKTFKHRIKFLQEEISRVNSQLDEMERLALQDTLVPIHNRRAFLREISKFISYSNRYNVTSSLIYFDLNDFKLINDEFGHAIGDGALLHVANVLSNNLRESDTLGRLGGDEFGVILSHTKEKQATAKGKLLATIIKDTPLTYIGMKIPITISYGLTVISTDKTAQQNLDAADDAMYLQKRFTKKLLSKE